MRFAVCGGSPNETRELCDWIGRCCAQEGLAAECLPFKNLEEFWAAFWPGRFQTVFVGAGGAQGFLTARRLREEDRACQVVLIDDSERYIMHSYRIHTAGFVVRPLSRGRVEQCVRRLLCRP